MAAWGAALSRDGPGLLLRDVLRGEDPGLDAVTGVLAATRADVVLLTEMDWDAGGAALGALAESLGEAGLDYPHRLALEPNAGRPTGLDLDGDGRLGDPRDAEGYGRFRGDGGLALLSRWPLTVTADLTGLPWSDLPGARPPPGTPASQRLSSTGHWIVEVATPEGPLTLMAWAATPPVFDGPEDRNGLRNADELALWLHVLDGPLAPSGPFVVLGNANLDPEDGQGLRDEMRAFLADPRLQDPHAGRPTADWPEPPDGPGDLRVTYVLPSAGVVVTGAGVAWPGDPLAAALAEDGQAAGPHRLVWADLDLTH